MNPTTGPPLELHTWDFLPRFTSTARANRPLSPASFWLNFCVRSGVWGGPQGTGSLSTDVKFGKAIDQDEKPTTWEKPTSTKGVFTYEQIAWDLSISCESLAEQIAVLAQHNKQVCRACLQLGTVTDDIFRHLQRVNSPDNIVDLTLDRSRRMTVGYASTGHGLQRKHGEQWNGLVGPSLA